MATIEEIDVRRGDPLSYLEIPAWTRFDETTFECRVLICPEETGGYSAHATRLPGVVSQGDTEREALENIRDAFRGAISVYQEEGTPVPWSPIDFDPPKNSVQRWILVDV